MSKPHILKTTVAFAFFVLAICIQPAIKDPTPGHWVFLAGAMVIFPLCFYFVLSFISSYKSSRM